MAAGFKSCSRPGLAWPPTVDVEGAELPNQKAVPCKEVYLGADHTIIVAKNGDLYSCGRGDSGQLGHGNLNHYFEPTRIEAVMGDKIRQVATFGARTIGISERDNFYIFGKSWGDGHGGVKSDVHAKVHPTPTMVPALSKKCLVSLEIGSEHGTACDNIGTVYTFGSSNDHLQLGTVTPWPDDSQPSKPLCIEVNESTSVRAVACGTNHTLTITSEDEGYTWGANVSGQLGLGHKRPVQRPSLLRAFKRKADPKLLKSIRCGGDYNAALTAEGELHMWGRNIFGQLGLGHCADMSAPQQMSALASLGNVRLLACGTNHVLCVIGDNDIHAWGRGVHGQLGNGFVTKQTTPRRITNLSGNKQAGTIVHVGAGENHSACVTAGGQVYSWGSDLYGQLGHSTGSSAKSRAESSQDEVVSSSPGPEDSMLSTPLNFVAGTRQIGKVTRVNFERSMRNANSPLRMPRGKVGPKIETTKSRRPRPEPKIKGAPVRRRNEELTKEVNTFIAGVATRLTKSAMLYSPPRNRRASSQLAPLDSGLSASSLSLAEGDFSYHERYAKSAAKLRRDRGQRRGTMRFIDDLLQARDDEQWILDNPEKWMRIKQERGGPTPDELENDSWDGRIR